jgi:hypothetical protein
LLFLKAILFSIITLNKETSELNYVLAKLQAVYLPILMKVALDVGFPKNQFKSD